MQATPHGMRLHIGLFGRRNVGKSALLNALTGQAVAIVSEVPGSTTDPVTKAMGLAPLGPVLLIDTAGIDDEGGLGTQRVKAALRVLARTDVALIVTCGDAFGAYEESLLAEARARGLAAIVVFNKADQVSGCPQVLRDLASSQTPHVHTVATTGEGICALRRALVAAVPEQHVSGPPMVADLVQPGDVLVFVVPIDKQAPKGRLILPQVQALREVLDADAQAVVVRESRLQDALARLREPPALVVTDSQALAAVAAVVPSAVPLTSFSVVFARHKGDLQTYVRGTGAIAGLRPGDRVLVSEACTHHPTGEDIGRVKIPRWLQAHAGGKLQFFHVQGHDFPLELGAYDLVIRCGACMHGRRETLSCIMSCVAQGVPITNYGLVIAHCLGLLPRVLRPFGLDANGAALAERADPPATDRREGQCGGDHSRSCAAAQEAVK